MASTNTGTNKAAVPEAKGAMDRFKMEVASELGVPLKEGYNGDLTSRQAGSIGGEMVKKMIMRQEQEMAGSSNAIYAGEPHMRLPFLHNRGLGVKTC